MDVSGLVDFETTLHVSDIMVPAGVQILTDAERADRARDGAAHGGRAAEDAVDLAAGAPAERRGGSAAEA